MHIASPWRGLNVVPDVAIPQGERQAVMFMYSGILAEGPAPPPVPPTVTPTPEPPTMGGGGGGGGPLDMGEESPPLKPILYIEEPADRFKAQRERVPRLREQLRVALEGPQAEEVRELVEPQPVDSPEPLHERVNLEALTLEAIEEIGHYYERAARVRDDIERRRQEDEEDDDDIVMLI